MNLKIDEIIAQNTSIALPVNSHLALVTEDGEIIFQGKELVTVVFNAVKKQAVNEIFGNVIPLNK